MLNSQNFQTLNYNKFRLFLYIIVSILFVLGSIYLTLNQSDYSGRYNSIIFILAPLSIFLFLFATFYYIFLFITGSFLIKVNSQNIIINRLFSYQNIDWSDILAISQYQINIPNPGSYGLTKIKQKFVEILTQDGKKHHISPVATGKNVDELLEWIKESCSKYPNLQSINFLDDKVN